MNFLVKVKEKVGPADHAPLPPSSYPYRDLCPSWEDNNDDPNKDLSAAERGTVMHGSFETGDLSTLENDEEKSCVNRALAYVEWVKRRRIRLAKRLARRGKTVDHGIEYKEIQVKILDQWGTVDRLLLFPQVALADMMDLKTGWNSVDPAERNRQMWGYMVGVWDTFPYVDKIRVHILSPRRDEISTWVYYRRRDYVNVYSAVRLIIQESKEKKRYVPGPKQCTFCGAKGKCPALLQIMLKAMPIYEPSLMVPLEMHASMINDPLVLDGGMPFAAVAEEWASAWKNRCREFMRENGTDLAHHRLQENSGTREITKPFVAWELLEKKGITLEEFLNCCSVPFGKAADLVREKAARGKKGREEKLFECDLKDRTALEQGAPVYQVRRKAK